MEDAPDQRKEEQWKCYDDEDCPETQAALTVKDLLVPNGGQSLRRPQRMEDASDQRKEEPWKCYDDEDCVEKQDAFTVQVLLVLSGRQSPERLQRMKDVSEQKNEEPWKCYDNKDCTENQAAVTTRHLPVNFYFDDKPDDLEVASDNDEHEQAVNNDNTCYYDNSDHENENCDDDDDDDGEGDHSKEKQNAIYDNQLPHPLSVEGIADKNNDYICF